jgi:hypothetical protein
VQADGGAVARSRRGGEGLKALAKTPPSAEITPSAEFPLVGELLLLRLPERQRAAVPSSGATVCLIARQCDALASSDVVVQELDFEALLPRLELDHISDRDDPGHFAGIDDWEMPDPPVGHECHAFVDRRLRRDDDQR